MSVMGMRSMVSTTEVAMNSPIRKKKTRRGKKKQPVTWRDMIPPSVPVAEQRAKSNTETRARECGCGRTSDLRSPAKATRLKKNSRRQPCLRPTEPRAPPNSTQFIMDYHLDNQECSLYPEPVPFPYYSSNPLRCPHGSGGKSVSPSNTTGSQTESTDSTVHSGRSLDLDFELSVVDCEQDMVSFLKNDFESVMAEYQSDPRDLDPNLSRVTFTTHEFDASSKLSSPTNSCRDHIEMSDDCHSPEASSSFSIKDQFGSWSNTSMLLDVSHARSHSDSDDSKNTPESPESFLSFLSNNFESELKRNKEESLYDKSSEELMHDILILQNRINILSKIETLHDHVTRLKVENQVLRSKNDHLSSLLS